MCGLDSVVGVHLLRPIPSLPLEVHFLGEAREPRGPQTFIPLPNTPKSQVRESIFLSPPPSCPQLSRSPRSTFCWLWLGLVPVLRTIWEAGGRGAGVWPLAYVWGLRIHQLQLDQT